jgi:uncharacterized membrane protein YwaF
MTSDTPFQFYGPDHLTAIALTIALPFLLAALVWRTRSATVERGIAWLLTAILAGNYVVYLLFLRRWGDLTWEATLPMQMCDWAMVVIIVTLLTANRRWFEVAYFWGNRWNAAGRPDAEPPLRVPGSAVHQLFRGALRHHHRSRVPDADAAARPYPMSIVRAFAWSELYFVVTMIVDHITGVNYGFLLRKPEAPTLLSFLSDSRPMYLFQMHLMALLFFAILYAPWAVADFVRRSGFRKDGAPST